MIIHNEKVAVGGEKLSAAKKVLIMLHGRGDRADSFIELAKELDAPGFAFLAPQAIQNTWYPYSFLMPLSRNEPQLSLSLSGLSELVDDLQGLDFQTADIFWLGFSQGACLMLEYCARHAQRYGALMAFTGGLLGAEVNRSNYHGDFQSTPVFLGGSDYDPHVPEERIDESAQILSEMGASVTKKIYPDMGHTINQDEITVANALLTGTFHSFLTD